MFEGVEWTCCEAWDTQEGAASIGEANRRENDPVLCVDGMRGR